MEETILVIVKHESFLDDTLFDSFTFLVFGSVKLELWSQCYEFCHYCTSQFVFHEPYNFLVQTHWQWMIRTITRCIESRWDVICDVRIEIFSFNVINEQICVHVTKLKFMVVIVELIHYNLTEIQYSLTEVNGFVHNDFDFAHLTALLEYKPSILLAGPFPFHIFIIFLIWTLVVKLHDNEV